MKTVVLVASSPYEGCNEEAFESMESATKAYSGYVFRTCPHTSDKYGYTSIEKMNGRFSNTDWDIRLIEVELQ